MKSLCEIQGGQVGKKSDLRDMLCTSIMVVHVLAGASHYDRPHLSTFAGEHLSYTMDTRPCSIGPRVVSPALPEAEAARLFRAI